MSEPTPVVRCAIYTRKSTEEGLEQDFNTLQAQREAAEAYILSQKQSGWYALPQTFDDGGFSGANLDRPALSKLLRAMEAREIDCVIVYKVDRLSRSLLDFARLLSLFEKHDVSFVSVTQDFNTTSSIGRLTLNILLSFAQFEREIIGERTRDKMSAARRKGKWMGGSPVLGYDIALSGGSLVVNRAEAEQVRKIFAICATSETIAEAARQINHCGIKTKDWTSRAGKHHPGIAFQKSTLDLLLRNPLYKGQISHKGMEYPGEQEAIVEPQLWTRVNQRHPTGRKGKRHRKVQTLLAGLLHCAGCGAELSVRYTSKGGIRYLYFVCHPCQKRNHPNRTVKPVACTDLEGSLVRELEPMLGERSSSIEIRQVLERLSYDFVTRQASVLLRDGSRFAYIVPVTKRRVSRKASQEKLRRVPALSRTMALAITCQRLMEEGTVTSYEELARLSGLTRGRLSQILLLANLAPEIQEQLLFLPKVGNGPDRIFEKDLRPILQVAEWHEQAKLFRSVWVRSHSE